MSLAIQWLVPDTQWS